ncbi:MMPL family transporter [Paenibacillus beijingensis]|uniref:Membrane protein n=1 Tax=Paenibacillus beijingensis TaxID=1126833 RepID=A0A0D5NFC2_9BACL|nr:MMPL family transporter [Paenibacillus beijingensis]AJY74094.1 membrane protein [Paenibacillus beijingensis]
MRTVIRWRWAVLALWIIAAAVLMATAPDFNELVKEKGQITVPEGYSSSVAAKLINESKSAAGENKNELTSVLVFHNDQGLSSADQENIRQGVESLKSEGSEIGITTVTSYFEQPDLKEQMLSKDGKTALVLVGIDRDGRSELELSDALYAAVADVPVEHYYTGGWLIDMDQQQSSMDGLKKTELITVVFILVILFIVFRSAVAPFIPLVAVGVSYLLSQSVVSFLAEYADFPISNFTQIFMVAVMFGIGTDYCILLISRYKEELAHSGDKTEAIIATYRTAGRTVLVSGAAVLVGFASIGFSTFMLYRSAVAVAVGVAVLLIALVTLVPFFMAVLGKGLFWPSRGALEHKQSALWGAMGRFSLRKPLWALIVLAVVLVPFMAAYKNAISFNSLDEIGDKYNSVKAFNVIADSFGPGDSMPSTVVIKADRPLDTKEGLAALEQVSRELANVDGVKSVRSATRPLGEPLDDLQVTSQAGTVGTGIGQGADGLSQIGKGLSDASSSLSDNAPKLEEAAKGAGELVAGTNRLKAGVEQLGSGLAAIEKGLKDGTAGAAQLSAGLASAKESADKLAASSKQLLASYDQLGGGIGKLSAAYAAVAEQQSSLAGDLSGLHGTFEDMQQKYPELQNDSEFQGALGALSRLQGGASDLAGQLSQLNAQLSGAAKGLAQANAGYKQAADGQAALAQGLAKLSQGIASLEQGVSQAAEGQSQVISKLPSITQGLDSLSAGQKELQSGFASLNSQLGELSGGLDKSVDGLAQVSSGLKSAEEYLNELSAAPNQQLTGWNMPQQALGDEDYRSALDNYLSKDKKTATFDVVFAGNPYDEQTLSEIPSVNEAVVRGLKGTSFEQASFAVSGITSTQHDLNTISDADYSRTVMLMLIGIAIILLLLFRSIVIPLYLIASLVLTYFSSMAIAEVIFVRMLGYSGISWPVPFFSFVLLMALGVDYSIFLMDRFREYRHLPVSEAILKAMKNMGGVIMSAAVILGGTFAAMLPSGVLSLMQIATVVLSGLFLYALFILPIFIPVMVRTFGAANWWPFMDSRGQEDSYAEGSAVHVASVSGNAVNGSRN